ncbi:MAG: SsrA-binding protein [Candidatus Shikimatogenerans sp. JK-2022]|nr:SsrA-binding protein [Candidatus Shikimatogenerans bostrichidophilus]
MNNIKITNKKAYYNFFLIKKYNAGMVLLSNDIKLIRKNKINLNQSFCKIYNNEIFLFNIKINNKNKIKLLLLKKEILKINQILKFNNKLTIIPTKIFFSNNGYAKIEIYIAKKKKIYDKKKKNKNKDFNKILKNYF